MPRSKAEIAKQLLSDCDMWHTHGLDETCLSMEAAYALEQHDNNLPASISTPPEGYEWTGEVRKPYIDEPFAYRSNGKWRVGVANKWDGLWFHPILRKLPPPKPATVDLIGVPYEIAEELAGWRSSEWLPVAEIARKALVEWEGE